MLLFDWSSLLGKNNKKNKIENTEFVWRVCSARLCDPPFYSASAAPRETFLINNVGVELLPSASLSLSLGSSLPL